MITGLGIWTKRPVIKGSKFGPFTGIMKEICEDASSAWEVSGKKLVAIYRLTERKELKFLFMIKI